AERFHRLYLRAGSALDRLGGLSAGAATRQRLESLLARAHAVSSSAVRRPPFDPLGWALREFPRAFQRHVAAFWLAVAATGLGVFLGAGLLVEDPRTKPWLLPYEHLRVEPHVRVAREESRPAASDADQEATFAAFLMTHNIQVSLMAFCLGLTLGVGSLILMFLNGVMLGAICLDYLVDGQGPFLAGWLLPHGSVEIPAMLIAAQAGLVLGAAMVRRESGPSMAARVRAVGRDLLLLLWGMTVLLVWAGIIESYFSQIHEPRLPYAAKAAYGAVQLCLLAAFLFLPRKREGT
ncbi:MAG TPA: stage II sporulation protein M, partial [bacterium]|nr:stage II sporulation protein M [bacterium]